MSRRVTKWSFGVLGGIILAVGSLPAQGGMLYDAGGSFFRASGKNISSGVTANQFTLSEPAIITGVRMWLLESRSAREGQFEGFSGTLSWAIYSDVGNRPTSPPLFTGSDGSVALSDALINSVVRTDIFAADIDLPSINLSAGTYWLAVHEGAWGSSYDDTKLYWAQRPTGKVQNQPALLDTNVANPGSSWGNASADLFACAFEVWGSALASPSVPEPASLALLGVGSALMVIRDRRRKV